MGCEELDVESKDDESKEELREEESKDQLGEKESKEELREEVRNWASFRGQTLSRTGEWKRLEIFVMLDSYTKHKIM